MDCLWIRHTLTACGAASLLALSACGGGDDSPAPAAPPSTQTGNGGTAGNVGNTNSGGGSNSAGTAPTSSSAVPYMVQASGSLHFVDAQRSTYSGGAYSLTFSGSSLQALSHSSNAAGQPVSWPYSYGEGRSWASGRIVLACTGDGAHQYLLAVNQSSQLFGMASLMGRNYTRYHCGSTAGRQGEPVSIASDGMLYSDPTQAPVSLQTLVALPSSLTGYTVGQQVVFVVSQTRNGRTTADMYVSD